MSGCDPVSAIRSVSQVLYDGVTRCTEGKHAVKINLSLSGVGGESERKRDASPRPVALLFFIFN